MIVWHCGTELIGRRTMSTVAVGWCISLVRYRNDACMTILKWRRRGTITILLRYYILSTKMNVNNTFLLFILLYFFFSPVYMLLSFSLLLVMLRMRMRILYIHIYISFVCWLKTCWWHLKDDMIDSSIDCVVCHFCCSIIRVFLLKNRQYI